MNGLWICFAFMSYRLIIWFFMKLLDDLVDCMVRATYIALDASFFIFFGCRLLCGCFLHIQLPPYMITFSCLRIQNASKHSIYCHWFKHNLCTCKTWCLAECFWHYWLFLWLFCMTGLIGLSSVLIINNYYISLSDW